MWKYNKGEWSEIYTFAYLLSTGVLYSADSELNKIEEVYFPVLKIIREEIEQQKIDYCYGDTIKIYRGEKLLQEISKDRFTEIVDTLFEAIPRGSRAFEIPEAESFFTSIYCDKVKANSSKKEDITLQIQDIHTGIAPICGFSIKSFLGAKPTLINAGNNTNFVYVVSGCNDEIMDTLNAIDSKSKILDRLAYLREKGCVLTPQEHSISPQFEENLQFIDTVMPSILQYLLLYSYQYGIRHIGEAVAKLKEYNPMGYSNSEIYAYKVKKLLCACALGLTPERKDWLGAEDANGGYITVKADGSVVCYHLYNRTEFENYLFNHTLFDSPSTGRYNYASIYKENGEYKMKLCLQVRFS